MEETATGQLDPEQGVKSLKGGWVLQAAQALICAQVASNTADYTLSQWAPIYYTEVLNVPIAAVGAHLALPQARPIPSCANCS